MELIAALVIAGAALLGIVYVAYRAHRRSVTLVATTTTAADTNLRMNPNFVLVEFLLHGQRQQIEYHYDTKIYRYQSDFCQTHPKVTIKIDPDNHANFIVIEATKGDYSRAVASVLIGAALAWFSVSSEPDPLVKARQFVIRTALVGGVAWLIMWAQPYFAWMNFFTSNDDTSDD